MDIKIRREEVRDYDVVYLLVKRAFESAEMSDGNEQELVRVLRNSKAFIPELSLVAEMDGKIVGHILFTKAMVVLFCTLNDASFFTLNKAIVA